MCTGVVLVCVGVELVCACIVWVCACAYSAHFVWPYTVKTRRLGVGGGVGKDYQYGNPDLKDEEERKLFGRPRRFQQENSQLILFVQVALLAAAFDSSAALLLIAAAFDSNAALS